MAYMESIIEKRRCCMILGKYVCVLSLAYAHSEAGKLF